MGSEMCIRDRSLGALPESVAGAVLAKRSCPDANDDVGSSLCCVALTGTGLYAPAPGIGSCLSVWKRRVVDPKTPLRPWGLRPRLATNECWSSSSYAPGPGVSLGIDRSARLALVPKAPLPLAALLLNDLELRAASVDASYGLLRPGRPPPRAARLPAARPST